MLGGGRVVSVPGRPTTTELYRPTDLCQAFFTSLPSILAVAASPIGCWAADGSLISNGIAIACWLTGLVRGVLGERGVVNDPGHPVGRVHTCSVPVEEIFWEVQTYGNACTANDKHI